MHHTISPMSQFLTTKILMSKVLTESERPLMQYGLIVASIGIMGGAFTE